MSLQLLSKIILIAIAISNILTYMTIRNWLMKSKLGIIDSSILSDLLWTFFITIVSTCAVHMSYKKNLTTVLFLICSVLTYQSCYIFYRGFSLYFDPASFIGLYGSYWMDNPKHPIFGNISREFKCCGFHKVDEFSDIKCRYPKAIPCLMAISEALNKSIKDSGLVISAQAVLLLISAITIFVYFLIVTNSLK
ncbi:hypothetical protein TVAG_080940 [Trichomonas vaginalis G3]|uniref:Tetraspanin family protein n=1 Tax=Trichomonas vaginalis (strain ATCC PRA-98 / G3) TaxID=412133 RepID=A2EPB7_TRIV3|nr:hypothetical protein TVAGG3_0679590 [Trichomonas vaginalis G3]EAY05502.1 hypothetical protein TVAG_080940 [Trichomonas vaginalis G3]KAI5507805.1 hypothetical protein TVAGG3_0679590 [Trichomonas vaginalis G3]|eukprot:XP_001317725.1 hypothetical protein [Trichomonas vaginalis G3]